MMHQIVRTSLGLGVMWAAVSVQAGNWPQWRGPAFNGSSPETDLPTHFSKTENVKWDAALPGPASATPIIWEDRVFVSSTDLQAQSLVAMGLDRQTGRVLWNHKVADGIRRDERSNYAAPSPVTDGRQVIFYYGNGALAAFDFEGRRLWARNIQSDEGEFATQWTYASSPLLYDGRLYIQVLQRNVPVNGRGREDGPNDSYLLALDPASGKTLWKHIRPAQAVAESLEAFTTPVPVDAGSRVELLIAGGDCLTGHDPRSGVELWRWGTYNPTRIGHWRLVPSPVAVGKVAILCAPKKAPVYAIQLGLRGSHGESAIAWQSEQREISSDVATPLVYGQQLFVLNGERKALSKIDPATGKADWVGELGTRSKIESSPTAADGKIYFLDHSGTVFVMSAGDRFQVLHQAAMGGPEDRDTRSSIAISGGNLFIRTADTLYCIGQ
jgi:outer membrane protein assembly factor BamB